MKDENIDLSPRQVNLLRCIINEYTKTGEPVASDIIERRYHLGVSPATIRNEMVVLEKYEFLEKEHTSSGRVPTAKAFRFYIQNLMPDKKLTTAEEVSVKNDVWDHRKEAHTLLQHATQVLARRCGLLSVATTSRGDLYYFGVGNFINKSDLEDMNVAASIFNRFEAFDFWQNLLDRFRILDEEMLFLFEEEEGEKFSSVYSEFTGVTMHGTIGVIGPRRMHYDQVIPQVRYLSGLVENILRDNGV